MTQITDGVDQQDGRERVLAIARVDPAVAEVARMAIDRAIMDGMVRPECPTVHEDAVVKRLFGEVAVPGALSYALMQAVEQDSRYRGRKDRVYLEFGPLELSEDCGFRPSMRSIILGKSLHATAKECERTWLTVNKNAMELFKLFKTGREFTSVEAYQALAKAGVIMSDEEYDALKALFSRDARYKSHRGKVLMTSYNVTCQLEAEKHEPIPDLRSVFERVMASIDLQEGVLTTKALLSAFNKARIYVPVFQMSELHSYITSVAQLQFVKNGVFRRYDAARRPGASGPRADSDLASKLAKAGIADRAVTPSVGKRSVRGKRTAHDWGH